MCICTKNLYIGQRYLFNKKNENANKYYIYIT